MKKYLLVTAMCISSLQVYAINVMSLSRNSYWHGATIAYNIDGAEVDNIIGSAKLSINPFEGTGLFKGSWAIVGNLGNFVSAQNKEDVTKDIKKITQEAQGLNAGIGSVWEFRGSLKNGIERLDAAADLNEGVFRVEFITAYRINGFQNVGVDTQTVALNQFRNSLGLEYETKQWKNGGALSFSIEGVLTFFDETTYESVFNERKSSLFSAEMCLVLPMSKNMGLMTNLTVAAKAEPNYQFGIIIKPTSDS